MNEQNDLRSGMRIGQLAREELLGPKKGRLVIAACNAFLNLAVKLVPSSTGRLIVTPENAILELPESSGSGSNGMNYRGTYANANSYQYGDVVRVTTGDAQGVYVCVVAQSANGAYPVWPEAGNWELLAFGTADLNYRDYNDNCAAKKLHINGIADTFGASSMSIHADTSGKTADQG